MLRDGRITESERNDLSLDEFDPVNYIEDYPTEAIIEKVFNRFAVHRTKGRKSVDL